VAAAGQGFGDRLCAIRINPVGDPHYGPDIVAVRDSKADIVVLPKAESHQQARDTASLALKPVLAMIETAAGVLNAAAIAPATAGLIAGTNDLSADLGIVARGDRAGLHHCLQMIVLAARVAGGVAFDGVFNALDDEEGLARQCEEGRAFGFDGKSLIHPSQIGTANRIFGPSEEQVGAAERLIAASTGGAERFEGRMVEAMHVAQARALLAKARRQKSLPARAPSL
jgi:(3S)-malyl-CoA thioesterase